MLRRPPRSIRTDTLCPTRRSSDLGRFAIGGLAGSPLHRLTRSQLDRTLLLWIIPLSVAPPMFSNDVYSYLAQSEIAARGIDPYSEGRSEEHTSELQSLMRNSYAVFCLKTKTSTH